MRKLPALLTGLVWLAVSLFPRWPDSNALNLWMLNVGQGESILLREPGGRLLLFDGGPDDSVLSELGQVLLPWQRTINLVILSHLHSDHIRGLIPVLQRYHVQELWFSGAVSTAADYQAFRSALQNSSISPRSVWADGTEKQFGQLRLLVLHPFRDESGEEFDSPHDADVVVKVTYDQEDILLTGDLEEEHEKAIIAACRLPSCSLQANVFQVPHHGSSYGLAPAFLQAINPKIALIPVGVNNAYHHPGSSTIKKLEDKQVKIYRTDTQGRIHLVIGPDEVRAPP